MMDRTFHLLIDVGHLGYDCRRPLCYAPRMTPHSICASYVSTPPNIDSVFDIFDSRAHGVCGRC